MEPHEQTYGEYLREKRLAAGKTIYDVAVLLGLSAPYISDIERNKRLPLRPEINKILAEYLDIDLGTLNTLEVIGRSPGDNFTDLDKERFYKLYEIIND